MSDIGRVRLTPAPCGSCLTTKAGTTSWVIGTVLAAASHTTIIGTADMTGTGATTANGTTIEKGIMIEKGTMIGVAATDTGTIATTDNRGNP